MKLLLQRQPSTDKSTIGTLFVNDVYECDTLEDVVREIEDVPVKQWKVQNQTAIPRGTYPIAITYSPRFKKKLPLLIDVEGFSGVRIHAGNTAENTEGCILVGKKTKHGTLQGGSSRPAMARLQAKIQAALDRFEPVTIKII